MPKRSSETDPLIDLFFGRAYDGPKRKPAAVSDDEAETETETEDSTDDASTDDTDDSTDDDAGTERRQQTVSTGGGTLTIEHLFRPAGGKRRRRTAAAPAPAEQGGKTEGK